MKALLRSLIVLLAIASGSAYATTIQMTVNGLVCAFCAQGIEKKLRKLPATEDVFVSLERRVVAVALKSGQDIPDATLRKALTDAGYSVAAIQRSDVTLAEVRSRIERARQ
jgi:mercuric ion binding protein